ncbi:MAG: hypothetical protein H7840_01670 [Alphaproteobacteria bacterium]
MTTDSRAEAEEPRGEQGTPGTPQAPWVDILDISPWAGRRGAGAAIREGEPRRRLGHVGAAQLVADDADATNPWARFGTASDDAAVMEQAAARRAMAADEQAAVETRLDDLRAELAALEPQVDARRGELSRVEAAIARAEEERARLALADAELERTRVALDEVRREVAAAEETRRAATESCALLTAELDALAERRGTLEAAIAALSTAASQAGSPPEAGAPDLTLQAEYEAVRAAIAALEQNRAALHREVTDMQATRAELSRLIAEEDAQRQQHRVLTGDLAVVKSTLEANQAERDRLGAEIGALSDEHARLQASRDSLLKDIADARARHDAIAAEIDQAQTTLADLRAEQQSLRDETEALRLVHSQLKTAPARRPGPRRREPASPLTRRIPVEGLAEGTINLLGEAITAVGGTVGLLLGVRTGPRALPGPGAQAVKRVS